MNKKTLLITLAIIAALVIVGVFSVIGTYNNLVVKDQAIKSQWAQVETQYQRRFDLIPNLVNSTKGVLNQEKEVFGLIAEARTKYSGAQTTEQKVTATNQVESALSRLLLIVENYPNLRSSETMQNLMVQLEGTENRVSVERRRYNEVVQDYNSTIKRFPTNMIASAFGFRAKPYFKAVTGSEKAPKVEF